MRVAFVNPPVWHYTGVGVLNFNPNLGILMLASVLEENKHEVRCFDAEAMRWTHDMVITALKDYGPEVVGITGTTLGWPSMKGLVKRIKEATRDRVRVVLGGSHVSHDPYSSLADSGADLVVAMEGEDVIEDVVSTKNMNGVVSAGSYVNFKDLPWPARHLNVPTINSIYTGNAPRFDMPETNVNWQRGCPHSCSYCSHTVFGNRPIRHRDPEDVVEELKFLKMEYGIRTVFVYDDELIGVSEAQNVWLNKVLDQIIKADLGLNLKTQGRCNQKLVRRDLLLKMKEAGFTCLMLGCESGSNKVLEAMNKKTTPDDIRHTVQEVSLAGMYTFCFWMVGNLEETVEDVEETARLMRALKKYTTWTQVTICTPWVGSKVYEQAKEGDWFLSEDPVHWLADRPAMQTPWMTAQEMIDSRNRLVAI